MYTAKQIKTLFGVSRQRLAYWREKGLVRPSGPKMGRVFTYTFVDLLSIKYILKLQEAGVSVYKMRRVLDFLRNEFPELKEPLLVNTSISFEGKKTFVELDGVTYDAELQQGLLFPPERIEAKIYEFLPVGQPEIKKPTRLVKVLERK